MVRDKKRETIPIQLDDAQIDKILRIADGKIKGGSISIKTEHLARDDPAHKLLVTPNQFMKMKEALSDGKDYKLILKKEIVDDMRAAGFLDSLISGIKTIIPAVKEIAPAVGNIIGKFKQGYSAAQQSSQPQQTTQPVQSAPVQQQEQRPQPSRYPPSKPQAPTYYYPPVMPPTWDGPQVDARYLPPPPSQSTSNMYYDAMKQKWVMSGSGLYTAGSGKGLYLAGEGRKGGGLYLAGQNNSGGAVTLPHAPYYVRGMGLVFPKGSGCVCQGCGGRIIFANKMIGEDMKKNE